MSYFIPCMQRKFCTLIDILSYLFKGDICLFLYRIGQCIPNWLFRFNAGTIMATSTPRYICRNYRNYSFSRAENSDVPEISQLSGMPEDMLYERCDHGDWCHIARDISNGGKVVNVLWCHRGPCFIRGFGLNLDTEEESVYLYGAYTRPDLRMKGIINTSIKEICEYYRQNGIKKVYGLVERGNPNSYKFHLKLNFKPVAEVRFLTLLPFQFTCYINLEKGTREYHSFISNPQDFAAI